LHRARTPENPNRNEIERNTAVATHVNRFVVGLNAENRSAVLQRGLTNVQCREGLFWSATLWATEETPVDNTIGGDRSQAADPGDSLQPFPNGLICRALEIEPGSGFPMHHTDTLDCLTCVRGEIYLVTDTDEVVMQPGDTVIIRGVDHAWSNRSSAPCLLVGTNTDAIPLASADGTHMGRRTNKERVIR
jgi:quercetin dioxygenase-like cupin family protein